TRTIAYGLAETAAGIRASALRAAAPRCPLGVHSAIGRKESSRARSCQGPRQHGNSLVSGRSATVVAMDSSAISVSSLRKAFRDKTVLDGIDLEVRAGTVFALLGPNGAGKTTTVNVLTTLLTPDAGRVVVAGHDVVTETRAVRAAVGVTGQFASVDDL